jgi:hypothetical protein
MLHGAIQGHLSSRYQDTLNMYVKRLTLVVRAEWRLYGHSERSRRGRHVRSKPPAFLGLGQIGCFRNTPRARREQNFGSCRKLVQHVCLLRPPPPPSSARCWTGHPAQHTPHSSTFNTRIIPIMAHLAPTGVKWDAR